MSDPSVKDPFDKEDYGVDYSDWIPAGDTISTSTWAGAPTGLTLSDDAINNTTFVTTTAVEGGAHGTDYLLTNSIVTTNGLKKERSIVILVRNQ